MIERPLTKAASLVVVVVLLLTCRAAEALQGATPPLTDNAMARFADDLALSEAQRRVMLDLVADYQAKYHEATEKYTEDRRAWTHQHCLNAMPELDPSVDISDLPREEQFKILDARRFFEMGGVPPDVLNTQQLKELNDHVHQMGVDFDQFELAMREESLAETRNLLAPEQIERWPVATRRLDINMLDQLRDTRGQPDDPRLRVDMLAVLASAADEHEGELRDFADALVTPDRVLAYEKNNLGLIELARRVLAFETEYRDVLESHRRQREEHNIQFVTLFNEGDMEGAAKHELKMSESRRRLWNVRLRFVEDIANMARELVGDDASRAWQRRCNAQFCPVLYLEESTDMLYEKVLTLEDLDADRLSAIKDIYERHCAWREEFKPRVVRLEIAEQYSRLWSDPEGDRGATDRLIEAHQTRIDRAEQANRQLRALLPPDDQAAFDEWWDTWKKKQAENPWPMPINVRP